MRSVFDVLLKAIIAWNKVKVSRKEVAFDSSNNLRKHISFPASVANSAAFISFKIYLICTNAYK